MWCALGQQLCRWHPQRDVSVPDLVLGAGDTLTDRGFGLQQRTGNFRDGQPGNQPQRHVHRMMLRESRAAQMRHLARTIAGPTRPLARTTASFVPQIERKLSAPLH